MNLAKEREINYKMLRELVEERRAITELILDIRQHIKKLDGEIEQTQEYMSATAYINLRKNIEAEVKVSMREQIRQEIELEYAQQQASQQIVAENDAVVTPSVVPTHEIEKSKSHEKQKQRKISLERVHSAIMDHLKKIGEPVKTTELRAYLESELDYYWSDNSYNTMIWKMRNQFDHLEKAGRGYLQYVEEKTTSTK